MGKHTWHGSIELRFYKKSFSGNFSVGLKFLLVNMPLCERPASQSMGKSYPPPLPQGVRVGKLARKLRKIQHKYEFKKDTSSYWNILDVKC